MKRLIVWVALVAAVACGPTYKPPALSPEASKAWNALQAQRPLDVIRDVAQDGCICAGGKAPVFSEATVRLVTDWHTDAITIINAASVGWRDAVRAGLTALKARLPEADRARLGPYIDLALTVYEEVSQ